MLRQSSLFPLPPLFHGGELARGRRKCRRPFSAKRPLHLVLKARGPILRLHHQQIQRETRTWAKRFELKLYGLAVNHDHIHLVFRAPSKRSWNAFVRALTGALASRISPKIWALSPFSRVLQWGRDFRQALAYLKKNLQEAIGSLSYEKRKDHYRRFRLRLPNPPPCPAKANESS